MTDHPDKGERIAKRLARSGVCSRREAERWILDGRIEVDGVQLTTPAFIVTESSDIRVDGRPLPSQQHSKVWLYHKPKGLLTTHHDPQGRPTVFDYLPKNLPRVISIGRLDFNSEGLLLLTNDGELARYAELPSTGWSRCYRVRVFGTIDEQALADLAHGVTIEGVHYKSVEAELIRQQGRNSWLLVTLYEGKNREIRKIMDHINLTVNRLIRVTYGPFELDDLNPEEVREVPKDMIVHYFHLNDA